MSEMQRLQAELEKLKLENANLKTKVPSGHVSFKVSLKGAVSIYGLGRWPVTLYSSQVERLIKAVPALEKFVEDNRSLLTVKGEPIAPSEVPAA